MGENRLAAAGRLLGSIAATVVCAALLAGRVDAITVTTTDDDGAGSLRQAVMNAGPGETIEFAVTGTIALSSGPIVIADDLTIKGPGADELIVGGGSSRAFTISPGATVLISGLKIIGSQSATDGGDGGSGSSGGTGGGGGAGAGSSGGAILNDGNLTLIDCEVSGSTKAGSGGAGGAGGDGDAGTPDGGAGGTGGPGGTALGGCIYNSDLGTLSLRRSTISACSAFAGAGGSGGGGGAGAPGPAATAGSGGDGNSGGAGGSALGGCIYNAGVLDVFESTLSACSAFPGVGAFGGAGGSGGTDDNGGDGGDGGTGGAGGTAQGGAIFSASGSTLTMRNSAVFALSAFGGVAGGGGAGGSGGAGTASGGFGGIGGNGGTGGAGPGASGGAIYAADTLTIVNSTFFAASAFGGFGGAGAMGGAGGAITNGGGGDGGDGGDGGSASGGAGGIIYAPSTEASLTYVTATNGSAFGGSGGSGAMGGAGGAGTTPGNPGSTGANSASGLAIARGIFGAATLSRTILADNGGLSCGGSLVSAGFNLISDASCAAFLTQPTDLPPNTDPMLAPLALNPPGRTQTRAITQNSPAFNAIPVASCLEHEDQRGIFRPQGAGCDIGAYELIVAAPSPALDGVGLALLIVLLAAAGMVVLRRAETIAHRL